MKIIMKGKHMINTNEVITEKQEKREPKWLPCGHPDILKKIQEIRDAAKARKEKVTAKQNNKNLTRV